MGGGIAKGKIFCWHILESLMGCKWVLRQGMLSAAHWPLLSLQDREATVGPLGSVTAAAVFLIHAQLKEKEKRNIREVFILFSLFWCFSRRAPHLLCFIYPCLQTLT